MFIARKALWTCVPLVAWLGVPLPSVGLAGEPVLSGDREQALVRLLMDFDQIESVMNASHGGREGAASDRLVSTAMHFMDANRSVKHHALVYRMWAYEAFRHDAQEYRKRVDASLQVMEAWVTLGQPVGRHDELKAWFRSAALASRLAEPLPELPSFVRDWHANRESVVAKANVAPGVAEALGKALLRGLWQVYAPTAEGIALPEGLPPMGLVVNPPAADSRVETPSAEPSPGANPSESNASRGSSAEVEAAAPVGDAVAK